MSKRFTITIEEDEFGDLILPIPDEVCEDLGWNVGDDLEFDVDDVTGTLTLRKVEEQSTARPQRKPHSTAFTLMTPQEKEIKLHLQLEEVCDMLNGTLTHKTCVNSRGEETKQFVITYTEND